MCYTALHLDNSIKSDKIVNIIIATSTTAFQEHAASFSVNNLLERGWLVLGTEGLGKLRQLEIDMLAVKHDVATLTEDVATIKGNVDRILEFISSLKPSGNKRNAPTL